MERNNENKLFNDNYFHKPLSTHLYEDEYNNGIVTKIHYQSSSSLNSNQVSYLKKKSQHISLSKRHSNDHFLKSYIDY